MPSNIFKFDGMRKSQSWQYLKNFILEVQNIFEMSVRGTGYKETLSKINNNFLGR